jgi:hypothetical protein
MSPIMAVQATPEIAPGTDINVTITTRNAGLATGIKGIHAKTK